MDVQNPLAPAAFCPVWLNRPEVTRLTHALQSANIRFVFFGGALRDTILGVCEPSDIDLFAATTPEAIKEALDNAGIPSTIGGYGKLIADVDGLSFDIIPWLDPDFLSSDVQISREAIRRRAIYCDFTMNSLFLTPEGELYDFFGGVQDALNGRVHFNVDPNDSVPRKPPEILRFFRFHAWYGKGEPDAYTVKACKKLGHLLPHSKITSGNNFNIKREMARLLAAPRPYNTIACMHEHGILSIACGFPVECLKPLQILESLEMQCGKPSDYAFRLTALILGSSFDPATALKQTSEFLSLPEDVTLKIRTMLGLLDYMHEHMPAPTRHILLATLGNDTFGKLAMLHAARKLTLAEAHRCYNTIIQHTAYDADIFDTLVDASINHYITTYPQNPQLAFTLVEISVVLLIIGLITSGILVGRDLVRASELRSTVSQIERYSTAVNAFRLKYNCLPGDCYNARTLGLVNPGHTAIGDGNNIIGIWGANYVGQFETADFWEHLRNASLVKEETSSVMHGDGSTMTLMNTPALAMRAVAPIMSVAAGVAVFPGYYLALGTEPRPQAARDGHYFWITSQGNASNFGSAALPPADAFFLDQKTDDGLPLTGTVQAVGDFVSAWLGPTLSANGIGNFAGAAGSANCVNSSMTPSQYNITATPNSPDCNGTTCSRCGTIHKAAF
ncbi:MAG: hypothetical protein ACK502_05630 [Alphaproteobacteria bacterium]